MKHITIIALLVLIQFPVFAQEISKCFDRRGGDCPEAFTPKDNGGPDDQPPHGTGTR